MTRSTTALVLGGGGIAGISWELGVLTRLSELGVDVSDADTVIGTSAGSVVGSILRGGDPAASFRTIVEPESEPERIPRESNPAEAVDARRAGDSAGDLDLQELWAQFAAAAQQGGDEVAVRSRIGAIARRSGLGTEEESIERIAALRPRDGWPRGDLRVTALSAEDGSFAVFDARSGVDLARAVAASCAVPGVYPTVTIDGHRYMDGGLRSATNADLAAGFDRVLVLSCSVEPATSPTGPTLPEALRTLAESSTTFLIQADAESTRAFGANSLSMATRTASARAGQRQAELVAEEVGAFWSGG